MKVLNLYACLGGNRLLWDNCEVTAVELDPELARMYQERFPNDTVIVADAHQYLLDHYKEFDFIWSSPPCPTHSRMACVENVIPYYEPLIPAKKRGRHLYWTNFNLPNDLGCKAPPSSWNQPGLSILEKYHGITDIMKNYKAKKRKDSMINNLVDYEAGKTIFDTMRGIQRANNTNQQLLF